MSTDNTELTFVRCPACGSLVPAVSTRCKMCGASLDFDNEMESGESKSTGSSGRVRQKTASILSGNSPEGLIAESADTNMSDRATVEFGAGLQDKLAADTLDDPLSAYIEEVDVENESAIDDLSSEQEKDFDDFFSDESADDDFSFLDELDELEDDLEDEKVEEVSQESPKSVADGAQEHFFSEDDLDSEIEALDELDPQEPDDDFSMVVETGARKKGAESKLSFGEKKSSKKQEAKKTEKRKAKQVKEEVKVKPPSKKVRARKKTGVGLNGVVASKENLAGRLVGWLVSYSDDSGDSIELREGKCFITSESLRGTDLVLDDDSISSPHALLRISPDGGIEVQDLMSDHGVYVKKEGSADWQKEEDVVSLENGDNVRFGDIEFIVALVPYVGMK